MRVTASAAVPPNEDNAPSQLPPIILRTPPGREKNSAVLLRFAEPLLEDVSDDYDDFYKRIAAAVIVWNLANFPPNERETLIQQYLKKVPFFQRRRIKQELKEMLERKEKLFAGYDWPIVAFRVLEEKDEFRVEVMVEVAHVPEGYFDAVDGRSIIDFW